MREGDRLGSTSARLLIRRHDRRTNGEEEVKTTLRTDITVADICGGFEQGQPATTVSLRSPAVTLARRAAKCNSEGRSPGVIRAAGMPA